MKKSNPYTNLFPEEGAREDKLNNYNFRIIESLLDKYKPAKEFYLLEGGKKIIEEN